jgi:hypothetical protein
LKSAYRAFAPAVVLLCVPLALLASTMIKTVTAIGVPKDNATISLRDLVYTGSRGKETRRPPDFTAEVKTVRLDPMPAAGADPVVADWVFTGSNTDGQIHRVAIKLTLVDESGNSTVSFDTKTVLRPGAKDQSWSVHMKAPAKVWTATRTIHIAAVWFT